MKIKFSIGDKVRWNSIYGVIEGEVVDIIKSSKKIARNSHNENDASLRYKVVSSKTGKSAIHKGTALKRIG